MADAKISALPASTTPLAGTEIVPLVQGGVTKKVTVSDLTAGRATSASEVTASTGNFIVGTSGKGVDFSATPGPSAAGAAATSELLADYEEGTWTPVVTSGAGTITSYTASGTYTRVGRLVTLIMEITITNNGTGANDIRISGIPYTTTLQAGNGCGRESAVNGLMLNLIMGGPNSIYMYRYDNAYPAATNAILRASFTYFIV